MKPRASRMALIVASVPLETSRTCCTGSTRATISSASSTSFSEGVPKLNPRAVAERTASSTPSCAWPRIIGPQLHTRSTYSRPSTSVRYGPRPLAMKRGVPPTARKARTGELTPPGVTARARSRRAADAGATLAVDALDALDALVAVRLAWGVGSGLTPPLSDTPGCSAAARVGRGPGPTGQAMVTAPRMVGSAA